MPEPGPNVRWVGGKFGQAASSPSGSKTGREGRGRGGENNPGFGMETWKLHGP